MPCRSIPRYFPKHDHAPQRHSSLVLWKARLDIARATKHEAIRRRATEQPKHVSALVLIEWHHIYRRRACVCADGTSALKFSRFIGGAVEFVALRETRISGSISPSSRYDSKRARFAPHSHFHRAAVAMAQNFPRLRSANAPAIWSL